MRLSTASRLLAAALGALALTGAARAATPAVAANADFTLALSSAGKVYAWGWDTRGQLGSGRTLFRAAAAKIPGLPPMVSVDGGSVHVAAADNQGSVWTWGQDTSGQLGPRATKDWARPTRVTGVTGVTQVAATPVFTAARRSDGSVWVWGSWAQQVRQPQAIPGFSGITQIAAGYYHVVGIGPGGTVWTAGRNQDGQLGDGTTGNLRTTAFQVPNLTGILKVAAGQCSSIALKNDGTVWAWGKASCSGGTPQLSPVSVATGAGVVVDIYGGFHYSHAVKNDGTVIQWSNTYTPAVRSELTGIAQIVVDSVFETVARKSNGQVAVWGANEVGQHGQGTTSPIFVASTVLGLTGITSVATAQSGNGGTTHFALAADGDVYSWGSDFEGQLGSGSTLVTSVPREVAGLPPIEKIATGELASYAVDASGNAWAWGDNTGFALGDTTNTPRSTPVMVAGLAGVKDVAAGRRFALFLMNDGTVRQLGFIGGLASAYSPPATLSIPKPIASLAARYYNAFAVSTDGTAYSWGIGEYMLLGDGTTVGRTIPAPVSGFDAPVSQISVGNFHALARTTDGAVWSWGRDFGNGVLGDGIAGTYTRLIPARIAGITNATHVAAGYDHSLARLLTGQVRSWGAAALGDGPVQSRNVPGPVRTLANAAAITAGYYTSHAVGQDGVVTAWGGQSLRTVQTSIFGATTGDGTFAFRNAPVLVLRDDARGNLDASNWFLDLDAAAANDIPAVLLPKIVPVAQANVDAAAVTLEAAINFRANDYGKKVGIYVLGFVPPAFFSAATLSPLMSKAQVAEIEKAGEPVLVQLTPEGWFKVGTVIVAYAQGVIAGNGNATSILNGTPLGSIQGATFCIGYGESAGGMLSEATLGQVLTLEGATSTASGTPCVLNGVYLDGPASSIAGSGVTFNATVVGFSPGGSVQFSDNGASLGAAAFLAPATAATARASVSTSTLAAGPHSIAAAYSGDTQNPPSSTAVALLHQVRAAAPGSASVALTGPIGSQLGDEVAFTAVVTGSNPGGTVQFKDGAANLGAPQEVVGGVATLRTSALALGSHAISAAYGGDVANAGAASGTLAHTVYSLLTTSVSLASGANPAPFGSTVTLTATVQGTNPTQPVTFRDGATVLATVALSGSSAVAQVGGLSPGSHWLTASYPGDGVNQAVTSAALEQLVGAQPPNTQVNAFAFAPRPNVAPGAAIVSNTITVTGPQVAVPIVVTGGEYSIGCTGAFTSAPGTASAGQGVCVRHSASMANSTATYTTLTIGSTSATFASTTYPAAFIAQVDTLVTHYYQSALRRAPDAGGLAFWRGESVRVAGLGASVNEALYALAATFYNSAEYAAFNATDAAFATDLYDTFFDRAPDAGGFAYWTGQLAAGLPREVALTSFMFSPEFAAFTTAVFGATAARAEVDTVMDFYRGLLARAPDDGGFGYWVSRFRAAQCAGTAAVVAEVEAISSAFTLSPEYGARGRSTAQYVGDLYNAFLRRGGDLGGVQFWISQIATGARTREQVRVEFKNSPEFQARVNAIIAQGCL